MSRKWMVWGVGVVLAAAGSARAVDPPSVALDVPVLSSYVWRGQTLNDKPVVQPSLTVGQGGFALNAWSSYNIDGAYQGDVSEMDLTASYAKSVGPATLGGGVVQYTFPNQTLAVEDGEDVAVPGTVEVYASAALADVPLAPALTVYYDVDAIEGFYGHDYRDATRDYAVVRDSGTELTVDREIDRVYRNVKRPQWLRAGNLSLGIQQQGFGDVVVWNPWAEKCAALADMPDEDWRYLLCIEAAAADTAIDLTAGDEWYGRQTLVAI